ncbi:hypothetical protein R50345_08775 [Paenibacillus sp. FSL R5-0345]|uniref:hypothetical protein n=1 Tax=Paenibacillus sp. FSL R5-0345 TaxID=1536770 RepID=UPI0004F827B7|nr:hypothetical protein [Paenibacillus sp. FSL R5-0345]AIQ34696.1 hypothetical protein R50345_08775 [Paenibacillus sp. FSL R5-0345]
MLENKGEGTVIMLNAEDLLKHLYEKNSHRDASASFDGYFYQMELTLLHILEDASDKDAFLEPRQEPNGIFHVEHSEDYVKVYTCDKGKEHIRLAQMKHHMTTAGPVKYEEALLWLYYNYLLFLQSGNSELTFKSTIFHYDKSTSAKITIDIINNVMKKNLENDEDKQHSAYKLICGLGLDTNQRRIDFSGLSTFIKTPSMMDIQASIKSTLKRLFSVYQAYDEELFYAAAICKIKNLAGSEVSFEILKSYFQSGNLFINDEYYTSRILQLLEQTLMIQLNHIRKFQLPPFIQNEDEHDEISNEMVINYEVLLKKIRIFLHENFQNSGYRKSFLTSVSTNTVTNLNFISGTRDEFNAFMQSSPNFSNFIAKLAKIMYFHEQRFKEEIILENWFIITNEIWLFKYPGEKRQNGVVLGNVTDDPRGTLQNLFERFSKLSTRPNVWYLGNCGVKANKPNQYKLDITKVDNTHTPCYGTDPRL